MCASAEFTDEITEVVLYPENEEVNKMNLTLGSRWSPSVRDVQIFTKTISRSL